MLLAVNPMAEEPLPELIVDPVELEFEVLPELVVEGHATGAVDGEAELNLHPGYDDPSLVEDGMLLAVNPMAEAPLPELIVDPVEHKLEVKPELIVEGHATGALDGEAELNLHPGYDDPSLVEDGMLLAVNPMAKPELAV